MSNNILTDFQKILRGPNGTIFFVVIGIALVLFILKILPALMWLAVIGGLAFLAFRFFEKK
jgi:hypothetical protein